MCLRAHAISIPGLGTSPFPDSFTNTSNFALHNALPSRNTSGISDNGGNKSGTLKYFFESTKLLGFE